MQYFYNDEYLRALRENDTQVEHHLATSFGNQIKSGLRKRVYASEVAEDITQETLLRVLAYFRNGKTLRTAASLPNFVRTISIHVLFEMQRANGYRLAAPDYVDSRMDFGTDPENHALYNEQMEIARRALRSLPEREQRLIGRLFLDEAERDQVCEELHVSRRYLRVMVHRAISHLRTAIQQDGSTRSRTKAVFNQN